MLECYREGIAKATPATRGVCRLRGGRLCVTSSEWKRERQALGDRQQAGDRQGECLSGAGRTRQDGEQVAT